MRKKSLQPYEAKPCTGSNGTEALASTSEPRKATGRRNDWTGLRASTRWQAGKYGGVKEISVSIYRLNTCMRSLAMEERNRKATFVLSFLHRHQYLPELLAKCATSHRDTCKVRSCSGTGGEQKLWGSGWTYQSAAQGHMERTVPGMSKKGMRWQGR